MPPQDSKDDLTAHSYEMGMQHGQQAVRTISPMPSSCVDEQLDTMMWNLRLVILCHAMLSLTDTSTD